MYVGKDKMKITRSVIAALKVLHDWNEQFDDNRPITPGNFGRLMWPDSKRRRNWQVAGAVLSRLRRMELAYWVLDERKTYQSWYRISQKGEDILKKVSF